MFDTHEMRLAAAMFLADLAPPTPLCVEVRPAHPGALTGTKGLGCTFRTGATLAGLERRRPFDKGPTAVLLYHLAAVQRGGAQPIAARADRVHMGGAA
eukprot:6980385-Pyramimonas_sp.AAC.1